MLAVGVGPAGQPSVRAATFNDAALANQKYNMQGRRYAVDQSLDALNSFTFTASLFVPGQWIDGAPGKPGCELEGEGCARVALVDVELGDAHGAVDSSQFTPTLSIRMGFDNRVGAVGSGGSYNYASLSLGGPIIEAASGTYEWPTSSKGTQLASPTWQPKWEHVAGWEGALKKDAWNHFSLEVMLTNTDTVFNVDGSRRGCKQMIRVQW